MNAISRPSISVDLQSDTRTKPRPHILSAMFQAKVGDDCYGDDPSVNALQAYCAKMFGKEAALFTCSGTQSNQIALLCHTKPGDEIILDHNYHIAYYESAASAKFAQVALNTIQSPDGVLDVDTIDTAIKSRPRGLLYSKTRMIGLENTIAFHAGSVFPMQNMERIGAYARDNEIKVHLDGARLLNACVASGTTPDQWARHVDTVSLCFAKGLGAPFGSILVGDSETIDRAKAYRKMFGGGMHQAGFMAAAALEALRTNVNRLAEDHDNARLLHALLKESPNAKPVHDTPPTNIVIFDVASTGLNSTAFCSKMASHGVHLFPWLKHVRAITHQDVTREQVEWAAGRIIEVANRHAEQRMALV